MWFLLQQVRASFCSIEGDLFPASLRPLGVLNPNGDFSTYFVELVTILPSPKNFSPVTHRIPSLTPPVARLQPPCFFFPFPYKASFFSLTLCPSAFPCRTSSFFPPRWLREGRKKIPDSTPLSPPARTVEKLLICA